MKLITVTVSFLCVLLVTLPVTAAAATGAYWTTQKAEGTVVRTTLLQLPAGQRVALEQELGYAATLFTALGQAAEEMGNGEAANLYATLALRYSSALTKVRSGLGIERARCVGLGQAQAGRFARFRCAITSKPLSIPSTALLPASAGELPAVAEGAPRVVGPFNASLAVRVTGGSTMTSRQLSVSPAMPASVGGIE